jgi:DNA mismatch repair ATPase MutS
MLFTTDKQTLEDLNIFGRHGSDAIYSLFNRCFTRGGAAILEQLFRYPLSDAAAINERSGIIRFFTGAGLQFPFTAAGFEIAETYLANTDERTKLSAQVPTIGKRLGNIIAADTDTQQVYRGVQALAGIIQQAKYFITDAAFASHTGYEVYEADRKAIAALLAQPAFSTVLTGKQKPDHATMAEWDTLLRFKSREEVHKLLKYIYHLDVYMAIAVVARERGFCFPKALPKTAQLLQLRNVYHPQVKHAVPNTIEFTRDANLVFLTGANMAGKSTFMKSVSIAVFLAHMGFPVAAEAMEFAVFDGVYTTINLPDNLGIGASHFYAEVLRVKKIAAELQQAKRLFIVFDELFRGTNVKDAYEATIAIAGGFAVQRNSIFIISTHIIEAAEPLRQQASNISFHYLPTDMDGNKPVYTYRLREGVTADRHGMVILNNEGVLDTLNKGNATQERPPQMFITDKQTTDDLNLLGKFRPHSIFSLFNQTLTLGGERLLEQLFREPMTNQEAINKRTLLLRYFQEKNCRLPLNQELLGKVESYLKTAGGSTLLASAAGIGRSKLAKLLLRDERFDQWQEGLLATLDLLTSLSGFLRQLNDYPFPDELSGLHAFFADARMAWLSEVRPASELSLLQIARYQHLLLFVFRKPLEQLLEAIYQFDVYIAVSQVAKERGLTYAHALPGEKSVFQAAALWHPGLAKPVANPLSFSDRQNLLFLTGANMAGKSTFMKSFGIAVYLAHMGFPVAATGMEFSVMEGLYCSINVPDSLAQGYSHFYAEVLRVKRVAEEVASGKRLAVLFDELFKGTNVKDAYDATLACTAAFATYPGCFYIVSTHIIEVGKALQETAERLQFAYLPTVMIGPVPTYTYQLTSGITSDRQGMIIIENERIPEMLREKI